MDVLTQKGIAGGVRQRFLFFVAAPVVVACIETFLQLSMMVHGDLLASLGFALLFTVPGHFFAWAMTALIARFPAAARLPLPVLLMLGYGLSILVFRPYNRFIYDLIPVAAPHMSTVITSMWQDVARFLFVNVPAVVIWVGLNLLFIARLGYPVYGARHGGEVPAPEVPAPVVPAPDVMDTVVPDTVAAVAAELPDFCRAACIGALEELWAISAEEHYLRLRGRFGARMIRHSFGAALEQLPGRVGLRVHRSHWVGFGHGEVVDDGRGVRLADGTVIPVSSSYRQAVLLTEAVLKAGPAGEPALVPERGT